MEQTQADTSIMTLDEITRDLVQTLSSLHSISIHHSMSGPSAAKEIRVALYEARGTLNRCVMKIDDMLLSRKFMAR
jgi:hypothetical protein